MKLLVVVDMQNDFVTGAFNSPAAQAIVPNIVAKINEYKERGDKIVFTRDMHTAEDYANTYESQLYPPHCFVGTWGWDYQEDIKNAVDWENAKIYGKLAYGCAAYGRDLSDGLYDDMEEIELCGVCTDCCVISNSIVTRTFLPDVKITVDSKCCAGLTPEGHEMALKMMPIYQITVL
ncbi:MAG: cysteine hydrolase [Lachnospiraceae bacterium]|nr:cysteine hydrolase [Lachnospiraceae bacterium]